MIVIGTTRYYYYDGVHYLPRGVDYVVVPPPSEALVVGDHRGDVVYLSDVEPESVFVRGDLILDGAYIAGPIRLAGIQYARGLTIHPEATSEGGYAEIIYQVRPYTTRYKQFRAIVGIQDGSAGSVEFGVSTRGSGAPWRERVRTGIMTDADEPLELIVPLENTE